MGGYHRPVCVETVVGPFHHFSVEGWADNNNHMVETYSTMSLVMSLYVASIVSLCFPDVIDVSTLSIYMIHNELQKISRWLVANKHSLNVRKTK